MEKYQLRYASGLYWLVDMEQDPFNYKKPLALNEVGANIWNNKQEGFNDHEIAQKLSEEYGVNEGELLQDIISFNKQLEDFGLRF